MLYKELAFYFERLRYERGFSQESFIFDIVSISQYKRYLKGHPPIPFPVMVALSNRLGLKYDYILEELDIAKNKERRMVIRLMNFIVNYDYEAFDALVADLSDDFFLEDRNKLLYRYVLILKDLFQKKLSDSDALFKLKILIDYPNILKLKTLSSNEFMILGMLATLLPKNEQMVVLKRIEKILENPSQVISGSNEKMIVMVLVRIIKLLGMHEDFKKALFYCQTGIKICKSIGTFYSLDYLYYYASLCHHSLGEIDQRNEFIYLAIVASSVDGNPKKREKFVKLIEDDYHIDINQFMHNKWK
ncbi:hypothetical protein JV173_01790 [Acholeplasma equirhinis]|uniref:hypothetical protein n=1 Tax=Acholeplasma equirhinis TaxID=555393 RepID=UPI00197A7D1A|nr:hypothetical protein [Acholeplasma equirhinis]MBN3490236.1 hypothetical protein [Acholeplasma equirhinis]